MENIFFLIFRRMRRPLLTLVLVYAVAVLGFVLIPGQDDQGNPWRMDFFHAFYFVSYMATTIGFGEIPYEFTEAQRLWATFSLYATVIGWLYAIGNILTLVQDKTFQHAITERRFARRILRMRESFYLVCGYGETGSALIHALTERGQQVVVIDIDADRVNLLQLQNLRQYVPGLTGDAARPVHLLEAGLEHRLCRGVVALTNVNEVNLKVAITSKLLHPDIKVICRADSKAVEDNMASFGTDHIIDPFDTFAGHLAIALQVPSLYLLHEWLTGVRHQQLSEPVYPPKEGHWIICGYGRFGRAVYQRLTREGIKPTVVEENPALTGAPEDGCVLGPGTEAHTLVEAGIERAVGLVAGTDDDANNLSIIMTAREINSAVFVVARQNHEENESLFDAVKADMVMHPSAIIANKIRVLLGTPMLYEFMSLARHQDEAWTCDLLIGVTALVDREVPEVWELEISEKQAHAICTAAAEGEPVTIRDLVTDPRDRDRRLACLPLLLIRNGSRTTLPDEKMQLKRGDQLLICGRLSSRYRMEWTLQNEHALNYILTGQSRPQGWIWRFFDRSEGESTHS